MRAQEFLSEAQLPDEIEDFLYDLTPDDVGVEEFGPYRVHYEGFTDDCQSSSDYRKNPEAVYQQVFADHIAREGGRRPIEQNFTGDEDYPILYSIFKIPRPVKENFADGKVKGKSRPGRVKKAGASCKGSVSSLRAKAKKYGGEKGKMYHWCANMKGGKKRTNEVITVPTVAKGKREHLDVMPNDGRPIPRGQEAEYMGKKIGDIGPVNEVWTYSQGPMRTFVVYNPETRRSQLAVTGSRYPDNPDSFIVKGVYSGPKNTTRAADLYAWLVGHHGLTLISDRKQSPGGQRVWQELEQRYGRSVNVYAYNVRTNQPINTGTDDPESTHGTRGDTAQNVRLVAAPK